MTENASLFHKPEIWNREFKIKLDVGTISKKSKCLFDPEINDDLACNLVNFKEGEDEKNGHYQDILLKATQTTESRKRKAAVKDDLPMHVQQEQQTQHNYGPVSLHEEQLLLDKLRSSKKIVDSIPEAKRLQRILFVRKEKRERNLPIFAIEPKRLSVATLAENSKKPVPFESSSIRRFGYNSSVEVEASCFIRTDILLNCYFNVIGHPYRENPTLYTRLMGSDEDAYGECIFSPYTFRRLKPVIFQDYEVLPLKLKLLREIIAFPHRNDSNWIPPPRYPIDYCYVRPQHIPVVNAFCEEFFWPGIDLSECLQYPDFSCVALYRRALVGFAFMVPDVKCDEAYITYLFTHPEWRKSGIATFMLYHLIQTCMGKDVTLHVSRDNPALFLYHKFGFKIEHCIIDFYAKYLPPDSKGCRDALFLRLSK